MKKLTRKLFISILAAVFAVVALGTSTFAWITISNTASVEAFTGDVEAGEAGIKLSLDKKDWYTKIPNADLQAQITKSTFSKFADITSNDGVNFNAFKIEAGKPATPETPTKAQYIEFEIYVQIANAVTEPGSESKLDIYIEDSKVAITTSASGHFGTDVKNTSDQENINVANAARVSFAAAGLDNAIVYENAIDTQLEKPFQNTYGFAKKGFAYDYLLKKGYVEYSDGINDNLPVAPTEGEIVGQGTRKAGKNENGHAKVLSLVGDTIGTITVRVWIEGWDNECHHNILSQPLSVAFAFSSEKTPAAPVE